MSDIQNAISHLATSQQTDNILAAIDDLHNSLKSASTDSGQCCVATAIAHSVYQPGGVYACDKHYTKSDCLSHQSYDNGVNVGCEIVNNSSCGSFAF